MTSTQTLGPLKLALSLWCAGTLILIGQASCSPRGESATSSAYSTSIPTRFRVPAGTVVEAPKGQATLPEDVDAMTIEQHAAEVAAIILK